MRPIAAVAVASCLAACVTVPRAPQAETTPAPAPSAATLQPFVQQIAGSAVSFEMVPLPASPDGSIRACWVGKTEVPWELFDICVFKLDQKAGVPGAADAVTRPTKPYISVDRGFGHNGWPAISMSFRGATAFCEWLSAMTGRHYRLPSVAEWEYICGRAGIDASELPAAAWYATNAKGRTHKVASATADDSGLHDIYGNVGEWAVQSDGVGVVVGGCFSDDAAHVGCAARAADTPAWNDSDPQFPKSQWWLADANFVGMRLICEQEK